MTNDLPRETRQAFVAHYHRSAVHLLSEQIRAQPADSLSKNTVAPLCVALVTTAASYMECRINEYWASIIVGGQDSTSLSKEEKKHFRRVADTLEWKKRHTILEKYQSALAILGHELFDKGSLPYQDADLLIALRNELVHYEPKSVEFRGGNRTSSLSGLEKRLGHKIQNLGAENPRLTFPMNFLHQECAEWAATTAEGFVTAFLTRVGASTKSYVSGVEYDWE